MIEFLQSLLGPKACQAGDFVCHYTGGTSALSDFLPSVVISGLNTVAEANHATLALGGTAALIGTGLTLRYSRKRTHAEASSSDDNHVDIYAYQDQVVLGKLMKFHELVYLSDFGAEQELGQFTGNLVLLCQDGGHFQALDYAVVDRNRDAQPLSLSLEDWLDNILAFYLLSNTDLPATLRCFMPINHLGSHWTALNVNIDLGANGHRFFEDMKLAYLDSEAFIGYSTDCQYIDLNRVKNFIQVYLYENTRNNQFPFGNITLVHSDSVNGEGFHQAAQAQLVNFQQRYQQAEFYTETSIGQLGNTCAEFTVLNGVSRGLYQAYAVEGDSQALRQLSCDINAQYDDEDMDVTLEASPDIVTNLRIAYPFVRQIRPALRRGVVG